MVLLSQFQIAKAEKYIGKHCRPLELARFNYLFKNDAAERVVEELKKFQNTDGGFGNGLVGNNHCLADFR